MTTSLSFIFFASFQAQKNATRPRADQESLIEPLAGGVAGRPIVRASVWETAIGFQPRPLMQGACQAAKKREPYETGAIVLDFAAQGLAVQRMQC
jgi:hypothetical protein